jgi:hypothetical protein
VGLGWGWGWIFFPEEVMVCGEVKGGNLGVKELLNWRRLVWAVERV